MCSALNHRTPRALHHATTHSFTFTSDTRTLLVIAVIFTANMIKAFYQQKISPFNIELEHSQNRTQPKYSPVTC